MTGGSLEFRGSIMTGYNHWEDGKHWLRIDDGQDVYDEPISHFDYVVYITMGYAVFRNKITKQKIKEVFL